MAIYWLDAAIAIVVSLSVLTGMFRGFVKELISLTVWIIAFWIAMTYSQTVGGWLHAYVTDKTMATAFGFIIALVATLLVGGLINGLICRILHGSGLSGIDRLLGMIFGFVRGIFIVALLMLVVKMTSVPVQEYRNKSIFYNQFDPLVSWLYFNTPDVIKKMSMFDKQVQDKLSKTLSENDTENSSLGSTLSDDGE